jgi:hypothetical protein
LDENGSAVYEEMLFKVKIYGWTDAGRTLDEKLKLNKSPDIMSLL